MALLGSDLGGAEIFTMAFTYTLLGAGMIFMGRGFRKLKAWIKIPGSIFAALGLLGFPLGTLINGYILYLIHSKKGQMVLSEEYRDAIAATPHIKYKTPIYLVILLALVILVIFGGIGFAIFLDA